MNTIVEGVQRATVDWNKNRFGIITKIRLDTSNNPIFTIRYENGDYALARIFELIFPKKEVTNEC